MEKSFCLWQGSKEIFNIDPLPPRSHPADSENHSVFYISHPRISPSGPSHRRGQDREEDEILQQEEVGKTLTYWQLGKANDPNNSYLTESLRT